jgi:hypothetical protein
MCIKLFIDFYHKKYNIFIYVKFNNKINSFFDSIKFTIIYIKKHFDLKYLKYCKNQYIYFISI